MLIGHELVQVKQEYLLISKYVTICECSLSELISLLLKLILVNYPAFAY